MPIYDFTCQSCGGRFEKFFRSRPDRPEADCPSCGSRQTQRALSLVNAGASSSGKGAGDAGAADMPFCGRCNGPGPCGFDA